MKRHKNRTTLTLFFSLPFSPIYLLRRAQTVRDKCFAKCIPKPGSSLSSGEVTCISRCTDRYVDATRTISNAVLEAYAKRGGM